MTRKEYEANFEVASAAADKALGLTLREIKNTVLSRAERNELRAKHTVLFHQFWEANYPAIPEGWLYADN